jgi:ABC-type Fe3+ transport system permease subunit
MNLFANLAAGVIAALIWAFIFIRRIIRRRSALCPNNAAYRTKVKIVACVAGAIAFVPSLAIGVYAGILLGALLMEPAWRLYHGEAAGVSLLVMSLGLAVFAATLTVLTSYVTVRFVARVPKSETK